MAEQEEALDMSLEELIRRSKNAKKPPPAPRPAEKNRNNFLRPVPENFRPVRQLPQTGHFGHFMPVPEQRWNQPQRFGMRGFAASQQRQSGRHDGVSKLFVSNLDSGVTHQDIQLLFSAVGPLRRYAIHFDENGISQGTADVVYMLHSDALTAIEKFNGKPLDGKPINIELVGFNIPRNVQRGNFFGRFNGSNIGHMFGRRQGGGQVGGTKRARFEGPSPESLDADLAKYRRNR